MIVTETADPLRGGALVGLVGMLIEDVKVPAAAHVKADETISIDVATVVPIANLVVIVEVEVVKEVPPATRIVILDSARSHRCM